jgi:hypothetical protein
VQHHRNAEPFVRTFAPPQELRCEHDVPVVEDIGPDIDLLADDSLDWKTASIDDGVNVFDVDAMFRKAADGPDAGFRCHGSIVLCLLEMRNNSPGLIPGTKISRMPQS